MSRRQAKALNRTVVQQARQVINLYEAARISTARGFLQTYVRSPDCDLDRWTRRELMAKSRYWYRNSPIVRGLFERIVSGVIGRGLRPIPKTSSPAYNEASLANWNAWTKVCEINTRQTFGSYQRKSWRARMTDGGHLTFLTASPESGRRRIQGIEYHRLAGGFLDPGKGNHPDGITVDAVGRPVSYRISSDVDLSSTVATIPAEYIVHHANLLRFDQHHGEPLLSAALNTIHDVEEIVALEKVATKEAGRTLDIIEEGPLPDLSDEEVAKSGLEALQNGDPNFDRSRYYENILGPGHKRIKNGDKFIPHASQRPSPAWQGFMEFLTHMVCIGAGIPPAVLLQIKVGGADTRKDLAAAQRQFEIWQDDFVSELQQIWNYVQAGEKSSEFAPYDAWKIKWVPTRALTVDSGRESAADLNDVKAGLMPRADWHAQFGDDSDEEEQTIMQEAIARRERIAAAGMTVEEFVKLISLDGPLVKSAPAQPKATP